ncbi:MAG: hypothetical protein OEY05_06715 [Paracoccaceae bacterium]|nr:hypothetical protein [Paracoccaceae bacterium]MDH5529712.1 hypothetical protein [Paracoccaceae bacterium]
MSIGFVTKTIHAYLDYPVAFGLIFFPFVLGLGASTPLALWLSVATGIAALVLTLFTDHHLGVFRILPYKLHMAVDLAVGLMFIVAPFAFGFSGIDAAFYWINGLAVVSVISLHKADPEGQMS